MTYTMAYRDYSADTFAAAVAEMFLDPDIWTLTGMGHEGSVLGPVEGGGSDNRGYLVEHYEWDGTRLRVWFR